MPRTLLWIFAVFFFFGHGRIVADSLCRTTCGSVPVEYPFAIDDGCGAPQYREMFSCDGDLHFHTISGTYKVQRIDYDKLKVVIFDANMTTCNTLQPTKEFKMDDVQSVLIPPSTENAFILLNCSTDSPILHRYSSLCVNFSGNSCDEMYSCPALTVLKGVPIAPTPPPCCATDYKTLKFLSMEVLGCSHYTSIYNVDYLNSGNPLDWPYGIQLSYSVPDSVCGECQRSGGTCGYETETERVICLCNGGMNSTRDCGNRSAANSLNKGTVDFPSVLPFFFAGLILANVRGVYR